MTYDVLSGNELIIQGGLEAGFSLYTGYPGSPLAEYFNILYARKEEFTEKGIQVVIANSEANAAAMASGAKQAGRDCIVAMKSMGLHVASDALSVGNFANPGFAGEDGKKAATVIVVGDDPWSISTSTPADSRFLFKHLHIPFLEPSTPQELKDWIGHAKTLSQNSSVYCGLILTTFMAEGGGLINIQGAKEVEKDLVTVDTSSFDLSENVMVPPNSLKADQKMIETRFPRVLDELEKLNLNKTLGDNESEIGFISSGATFEILKQYLEERSLLDEVALYKLGCPYPLIPSQLTPWLKKRKKVIVVEEKRGFIEEGISHLCLKEKIDVEVWGKMFGKEEGFPAFGGISYEILAEKLCLVMSLEYLKKESVSVGILPRRLPTFCPGCPHRETLSLLKELRIDLAAKGIDLVSHGDVGCYSLSFLPPFKEMHNLSAMGQGGALGAGMDLFTKNPSVVLMGDSTFYHSGLTDVSNSVQLDHDITYIILDNDNTAMTGHQSTPASGFNVQGKDRPRQNIIQTVRALGVSQAVEVNPSDRYFYKNLLGEWIEKGGVKVIVSKKECGLTFYGRKRREQNKKLLKNKVLAKKNFYQINVDACEDCRACVDMTGCPGLTQVEDAYGPKMAIDKQICVGDGYCTTLKACPSFELVQVLDFKLQDNRVLNLNDFSELASPRPKFSLESLAQEKKTWRAVVTGVGGSGVTTISRLLSYAAKGLDASSGLEFKYVDQKGLAQRNGNVTGHISLYPSGHSQGGVTPLQSADILFSPDFLDGVEHLNFLSSNGHLVLNKDFQTPLSLILDKSLAGEKFDQAQIQSDVLELLGKRASILPFNDHCIEKLGKAVYTSSALLGASFQRGLLPFTEESIFHAIDQVIKKEERETNKYAFKLGRSLVAIGDDEIKGPKANNSEIYLSSIRESFLLESSKRKATDNYKKGLVELQNIFGNISESFLRQYCHDICVYDGGKKIEEFTRDCTSIREKYPIEYQEKALRTLAKTYFIKDEVMVAHLMVSPLKISRDREAYQKLGRSYEIKRMNRPQFDIAGFNIAFDLNPKTWMLKTMRFARFLRPLLSSWHKKERKIAAEIRGRLIAGDGPLSEEGVHSLDRVKGYREYRYESAQFLWEK